MATDETGSLAGSFNRMVAGLEERERLREAFGTFVDPDVAERVLRQGTILEGEEVEVTVLFLDIRDFTAYAERASAHDVVARLNDFYEHVVPVLLRHGGHANKFVGDGLLAVFGAPERWPDHADRAVAAALEIARVVEEVYRGELRIGIGVNSGTVAGGHDRRRRPPGVHRHRRRGQHRRAGRAGHARDGRHGAPHRRDAAAADARPRRLRGAPRDGAQGQERARRAVRAAPHRGRRPEAARRGAARADGR